MEDKKMPLLKPNKEESQEEFTKRFMSDESMVNEYPDEKQRMAICVKQWDDKDKNSVVNGFYNKSSKSDILDLDNKTGIVKVMPNSFHIMDDQDDISMPGSFNKTISENFNNIFWHVNHDKNTQPGITKELYEDKNGLIAVGVFNLKKKEGLDLYSDYQLYGEFNRPFPHSVRVMSIKRDNSDIRKVLEWKMKEWSSLTDSGSNPYTPVLQLKNSDEIMSEIIFIKKALEQKYSDERLKNMENQLSELQTLLNKAGITTLSKKPNEQIGNALDNLINKITIKTF